ncbi:MAG: GNAT family N-acetyltransferase [bacterium]
MSYKTYETERLYLRPTQEEDAPFILELLNTPKWIQFIGDRKVHTEEDAANYIKERMLPQLERLGFSNYTVILKSDGTKIGTCGLYDREGLEGIDIGFAFLPAFEGRGFGYESSIKMKELAFNELEITTIRAITSKGNIASQKLLKKLGLVRTGTTILPDEDEELFVYQIDK